MAVDASATYGGKRYSESVTSVTARLYIGVHARVASVTAARVALWPFGHVRLHEHAPPRRGSLAVARLHTLGRTDELLHGAVHLRDAASSDAALVLVRKCLGYSTPRLCQKPYCYLAVGEAPWLSTFALIDARLNAVVQGTHQVPAELGAMLQHDGALLGCHELSLLIAEAGGLEVAVPMHRFRPKQAFMLARYLRQPPYDVADCVLRRCW